MRNLIPAFICLFLAVPCGAEIFIVDDDGSADFDNIQEAIDDCNDGDIVIVKSGSWRDKAGAYAIQEGGDEFVERIDGSLTNVMGLPMELLQGLLKRFVG